MEVLFIFFPLLVGRNAVCLTLGTSTRKGRALLLELTLQWENKQAENKDNTVVSGGQVRPQQSEGSILEHNLPGESGA